MDSPRDFHERRRVLTILATTAVALPVLGLAGCGGDKDESGAMNSAADNMQDAASEAAKKAESGAEKAMDKAQSTAESAQESMNDAMDAAEEKVDEAMDDAQNATSASSGGMPRVDENSAQAQSLAYVHDASSVDASAQPRYESGQQCSNCALYQGGDAAWGGCPLFAGKQVKATGWCNAYAPAA